MPPHADSAPRAVTPNDLKFLKSLAKNNNREWFQKHKADFEAAQSNFLDLVGGLIFALSEYDEALTTVDPKSCIFRIYRDVRFSKDRSPYKNHLGAFICSGGRKSDTVPGYYIHIEPGGKSIYGAGLYMPHKDILDAIRRDIVSGGPVTRMIDDKTFRKQFPEIVNEDAAKKVPRGYPADHPRADLLKQKHCFVYTYLSDAEVVQKKLLHGLAKTGKSLFTFNKLLQAAARRR